MRHRSYTHPAWQTLTKVPKITAFFWVIKLLSTAMGEAASDYMVHQFNPYLAVVVGFLGFVAALILQFRVRRYVPWVYWLAVVMVAVFGTMAADVLHVEFNVPYIVSTSLFAIALAAVFISWYASEKTLSIHSIHTQKRELFYWATVMAAFAMGTAAGDMAAYTLHLGFLDAGLVFALLFIAPGVAFRWLGLNAIAAFWFAYIITRPLGASFADWMGKPQAIGGLGYGDGPVALVLTILIIAFVGYLSLSHKDSFSRVQTEKRLSEQKPSLLD